MKKIYIIAESYEAARRFAYKQGFHYTEMVYIYSDRQLRGLKDITIYITSGAYIRDNYSSILMVAKGRPLNLLFE